MSVTYSYIRRKIANEMDLWGGDPATGLSGTLSASSADLSTVIDTTRPEPDDEWDGCYIVFNPGTANAVWRRVQDSLGWVAATGTFTLTTALPNSAYTASGVPYEIYKSFRPEQWLAAINYAVRKSYPYRHRMIWWEAPEDNGTIFYDWGHMVSSLTLADPSTGPTVTAYTPGGAGTTWPAGTYKFAISYYNSVGQTLISSTTTLALTATQCPNFALITVPEQATGVIYWATPAPGGSQLARLTIGDGKPDPAAAAGTISGVADLSFKAQPVYFIAPPGKMNSIPPTFNTTSVDVANLASIYRRTNPGQYPERFIDLAADRWRGAGGQTVEIRYYPITQFNLRFICTAPGQLVSAETDLIDQPEELLLAGAQWYLWDLLNKTASAQNLQAWTLEANNAKMRFEQAKADYKMEQPRRTMRRPFIAVNNWFDREY